MRTLIKKLFLLLVCVSCVCLVPTSCSFSIDSEEPKTTPIQTCSVKILFNGLPQAKGISITDGEIAISFDELTHQKIKLVCAEETYSCSLAGATDGFEELTSDTIQLSYGKWTIFAEGYKDDTKYYKNTTGLPFIVGSRGATIDNGRTWESSILINETFCNSSDTTIKANSKILMKNEFGSPITFDEGINEYYELKWYKTTTNNPVNLTTSRTISDLQEQGTDFTEWKDPDEEIDLEGCSYVLVAIVAKENPSDLFGAQYIKLENLKQGYSYSIGEDSSSFVQFGKYSEENLLISRIFKVGSIGPSGGYIFYDCDADNSDVNNGAGPDGLISNICGWQYLETAPNDINEYFADTGVRKIDQGYAYLFGAYRVNKQTNLFVNGTNVYSAEDCTRTGIGEGQRNTELLVETRKNGAFFNNRTDSLTTAEIFAAKVCDDYKMQIENQTIDDWFLPSIDELELAIETLVPEGKGAFSTPDLYTETYYWSSSEANQGTKGNCAWGYSLYTKSRDWGAGMSSRQQVRAVRAFLPCCPYGHSYELKEKVAETCTTDGIYTYECSVCHTQKQITVHAHHKEGSNPYICEICSEPLYSVGDRGPAGGWIIYDCDADNISPQNAGGDGFLSSECGWRFIEASPRDLVMLTLYGPELKEEVQYTSSNIGDAFNNKELIKDLGNIDTSKSLVSLANNYSVNGYDDWMIPTYFELNLMYTELAEHCKGFFDPEASGLYWSSSSVPNFKGYFYCFDLYHNNQVKKESKFDSSGKFFVRFVRYF